MAAGSSSSRRKSSSSHKKKPSEVRKKRKSRTSKRDKSKKVRCRDASVSSSDDDSRTEDSLSISSSDSEDGYRHSRSRSRTRGEGKSSKKRVRRSSPSRDDSKDSTHRRKKKGVKRDDGSEARKKTHKRKRGSGRSRRGRSVDSVGSDSLSCSTCRSGSRSENEGEIARGRSKRREKGKTSLCETSNGKRRYRYNSRSCSSCSERSNHGYDERSTRDNHTRRLGSVLTVVNEEREEERRAQSRDVNKDEIVQSYEDIPPSRSDDSYDGRGTKQSYDRTHAVYEKKGLVDDGRIQESSTRRRSDDAYDEGRMKQSSYQEDDSYEKKRWLDDGVSQEPFAQSSKMNTRPIFGHSDPTKDVTDTPKIGIKSEIGNIVSSTPGHDLESILRQKALENLKKFRGELQTNKKASGDQKGERDNDVNQPSPVKAEAIQNQFDKEVDNGFTEAKRFHTNVKDYKGSRDDDVKLPSLVKAEVNRNKSHNEVGVRGSGTKGFHTNVKDYKDSRDGDVNLPSLVKAEVNRNQSHNEVGIGGSGTKGLHTNTKALDDQKVARNCLVRHLSTIKAEAIQNQSHKEVVTGVAGAKRAVPVAPDMENIPLTTRDKTSANYMKGFGQSPDKDSKRLDSMVKLPVSQTVLGDGKSSSERMVDKQDTNKTNTSSVTNKFSEATSTFKQEPSHSSSIIKQVPTPRGCPNGGLNKTEISLNKDVAENSKDASGSIKTHDVDKALGSAAPKDSSSVTSATGEQGSSDPGAAAKGGSEFEQKTMSVMRGGEMVQVSYKVYIPKKTPALARRQLKR